MMAWRNRASLTRDAYVKYQIPAAHLKVSDKLSDAVAYLYEHTGPKGPRPCAAVFFGKQSQPMQRYQYRSEAEREASVTKAFESRRAHDKRIADARAEDKAFVHSAQVGDIYRTSWGYDQTNVEFFEIVEIRGKFAVLREIACAVDERTEGGPQERIVPQSGKFIEPRDAGDSRDYGKPIRRLIQKHGIKIDDVRTAWPWGKREPITGTVLGQSVSRTGFGWGH